MEQGSLLERLRPVKGLDAVADAFAATVTSDVLKMQHHRKALFIVHKGVGTTGTSTLTVQACDNAAGDNPVAIPFRYQAMTSGDTLGAITAAAAAGFATTAGSSQLYLVEVDAIDVLTAGKGWVFLQAAEVVDSPVLGGIIALLAEPRFAPQTDTVIA